MIPGALPFTSSAAASNNLQAGSNFPSQAEFAWKCPDRKHLTATPRPRMQAQGPSVEPCLGMESPQPSWDLHWKTFHTPKANKILIFRPL